MGKKELLKSVGEFSNQEGWNKFFAGRPFDSPYEWYAEWPEFQDLLLSHLSISPTSQILVPGCGTSRLSEHLYDAGFHGITNIDFAKVAISHMSRRNTRERPYMRWRVMNMTTLQFGNETFDAIIDKGGLDALVESEDGAMLASQYLSEVKRVTKSGGKFICFTFADPHVTDLLFSELRVGWKTKIEAIAEKSTTNLIYPSFMVVAEKAENSSDFHPLVSSLTLPSFHFDTTQETKSEKSIQKGNCVILHSLLAKQFGDKREVKDIPKNGWISNTSWV